MRKLWIDLETRSRVDLKRFGVYRYVRCPDFKILMVSWSLDGSPIQTALSYEEIYDIPGLWDLAVTKIAHNAAFERVCLSEFANRALDWDHDHTSPFYLPPEQYHDTAAVAAELGYPRSLEGVAKAVGAPPKDTAGTRLINLFCKPNKAGGWNDHTTHPMEWLDFIAYCEQDVDTLIHVDAVLGDFPTETERQVYLTDQRINDRGLPIDVSLAGAARVAAAANTVMQKARATELSGLDNPNSVIQLRGWLCDQIDPERVPDVRKETIDQLLKEDLPPVVHEVLELRQELALAAPAKFASAISTQVDGRLRGTFLFFGAHTGRWSGRGTQPHNLPRLGFHEEDENTGKVTYDHRAQDMAILDLLMGLGGSSETMKKLVRPMFLIDGVVVDYRAIEAFVIAWLAGEEWVLEAARDPNRDIYLETAERMGGLTRPQGKIAVLALGFAGSANSLRVMAGAKDSIALDAIPGQEHRNIAAQHSIDPDNPLNALIARMDDDVLKDLFVYPWRAANPQIVKLWARLGDAFITGGRVGEHLSVEKDGNDRLLRLPSGRAICYRGCGYRTFVDKKTGEASRQLSYKSSGRNGAPVKTYGGKLAENATQAVARDVLAEALVRLDAQGHAVIGHTHDEILVAGTTDLELVKKIACEPPGWAAGLPIDGEGFVTRRYRKG